MHRLIVINTSAIIPSCNLVVSSSSLSLARRIRCPILSSVHRQRAAVLDSSPCVVVVDIDIAAAAAPLYS